MVALQLAKSARVAIKASDGRPKKCQKAAEEAERPETVQIVLSKVEPNMPSPLHIVIRHARAISVACCDGGLSLCMLRRKSLIMMEPKPAGLAQHHRDVER